MAEQENKDGKLFLHTWIAAPGFLLHHLPTGLKFFCEERSPTPDDPDNWNCYVFDVHADGTNIAVASLETSMTVDELIDYLAKTSMELADKAKREQFWPSFNPRPARRRK